MNKIIINEDSCIGCGSCIAIDPEHFDFNSDGLAVVINENNDNASETINAIASCPTSAISITSEDCDCSNCSCNCGLN